MALSDREQRAQEHQPQVEGFDLEKDYTQLLAPNPQTEEFFADNQFWKNLESDADIPLDERLADDPFFPIVGKKQELELGKQAVVDAAKRELRRRDRFEDLSMLLTEVEYYKDRGHRQFIDKFISDRQQEGGYDWEVTYKAAISALETTKGLDRRKHLLEIQRRRSGVDLDLKIDESLITEKLREEFETPMIYFLVGPMGSGKSFIQRRLQVWQNSLFESLGLKGYDRMIMRNKKDPSDTFLRTFLGGKGRDIEERYEARQSRKNIRNAILKTVGYAALFSVPLYETVVFTYNLAQLPWGLGIGVDPFIDFGRALHAKKEWVFFGLAMAGAHQAANYVKRRFSGRDSERPNYLVNARETLSVIVGATDRDTILGRRDTADSNTPPQKEFSRPSWLATDGRTLTIEQVADLPKEAQELLAQMIQENELPIADQTHLTTYFSPLFSLGLNPHLSGEVIAPLMDRMKLGYRVLVRHEIDASEDLAERTKREFWGFIRYFRKENKPFNREALEATYELSQMLSERDDSIVINREMIGMLTAINNHASKHDHETVQAKDVWEVAKTYRSLEQQVLEARLQRDTAPTTFGRTASVRVLGLYTGGEHPAPNEHEEYIAQINGLGYIIPITAHVEENRFDTSQPILTIIPPEGEPDAAEKYATLVDTLASSTDLNLAGKKVTVDLSYAMHDDEALMTGVYIALRSALDGEDLDQQTVVATSCDHYGNMNHTSRLHKRLMTVDAQGIEFLISPQDHPNENGMKNLGEHFDKGFKQVTDLKSAYEALRVDG